MRVILSPFLAMIVLAASASAQMDPPELMWAREYFQGTGGGKFFHVIEAAEGGFIVAGWDFSSGPATHCVYRMDEDGDITWSWDPGYFSEGGDWVLELANGDIIVTGFGKPTQASGAGPLIARLTSAGSTVWVKCYPAPGSETYCIEPLPDGGYAVCGAINSNDSWLLRTDSQGDTLWTRVWDSGGYDRARRVVYHDEGLTVFISANTPRLLRYSMDGELLWIQTCPGIGGSSGYPGSMCSGSDSGYVTMDTGEWDGVLAHTDWDGLVLWQYPIPGEWSRDGSSVTSTMDGGYLVSGWNGYYPPIQDSDPETRDGWLVRFDSVGQYQWIISNEVLVSNQFNSTFQCSQGGYIVAGQIWDTVHNDWNGYLLRYAPETGVGGEENPEPFLQLNPSSNPFSASVTITCMSEVLPEELCVYDMSGRHVRNLVPSGSSFTWDGRDASGRQVPVGTYMIQGAINGQVSSIRVVRL